MGLQFMKLSGFPLLSLTTNLGPFLGFKKGFSVCMFYKKNFGPGIFWIFFCLSIFFLF